MVVFSLHFQMPALPASLLTYPYPVCTPCSQSDSVVPSPQHACYLSCSLSAVKSPLSLTSVSIYLKTLRIRDLPRFRSVKICREISLSCNIKRRILTICSLWCLGVLAKPTAAADSGVGDTDVKRSCRRKARVSRGSNTDGICIWLCK